MAVYSRSNSTISFNTQDALDWNVNSVWRNDPERQSYAWVFNSLHPGGGQFVYADASTHFLAQTIDYRNFCRLNYIRDAEPLTLK